MTVEPNYSPAVGAALSYAANAHVTQLRKNKHEWYLSHLLRVAGLVMRYRAGQKEEPYETEVIAALLHDCPEDQGGQSRLDEIEAVFGKPVRDIVHDCSDSLTSDPNTKADWLDRKLAHLKHLSALTQSGPKSLLVIVCDKMANLEDIANDIRTKERAGQSAEEALRSVLNGFNGRVNGTRAYYSAVYEITSRHVPADAAATFRSLLAEIVQPPDGERPLDEILSDVEAASRAARLE